MFSCSNDIVHSDFIRFLPGYVVQVEIHTVNATDTDALPSIPPACKQEMLQLLANPVKNRLELLENSHHRRQQKSLCFSEPQLLSGKTVKIAFSFKPSSIRNHSVLAKTDISYRQLRLFPEKLVVFSYLSDIQPKVVSNEVGVVSGYFRSTDTTDDTSNILLASDCRPTVTSKCVTQRSANIVTDTDSSSNNNINHTSNSQHLVKSTEDVASAVSRVAVTATNRMSSVATRDYGGADMLPCMTATTSNILSKEHPPNNTEKSEVQHIRRKSTTADQKQQKSLSLSRFKFQPLNRLRHRLLKNAISPHVAAVPGSARRRSTISHRNSPASLASVASSPGVSSATAAVGKHDENSNSRCEVNQMQFETSSKEDLRAASYDGLPCSPLLTPSAGKQTLSLNATREGHPVSSNSRNLFSTFGFASGSSSPAETSIPSNIEKTQEAENCDAVDANRLKLIPERDDTKPVTDACSSTDRCIDTNTIETIVIDDEDDVDGNNSSSAVEKCRQRHEKLNLPSQRRLVRQSSGSLSVTLLPLTNLSSRPSSPGRPGRPSSPGRQVHEGQSISESRFGKLLDISASKPAVKGQTAMHAPYRQLAHISCGGQPNGGPVTFQFPSAGSEQSLGPSSGDQSYAPEVQCKEVKSLSAHSTHAGGRSYQKSTTTGLRPDASLIDNKDNASVKTCANSISDESVQLPASDHVTRRPLSRKLALKLHKKTGPGLSTTCDGNQHSGPQAKISSSFSAESNESSNQNASQLTESSCNFSTESKESVSIIKHRVGSSDSVASLKVSDKIKDESCCGVGVKRERADGCCDGLNPKRSRRTSDTDNSDDDAPGPTIKETIILASRCSSVDSELEEKRRLRTVLGITGVEESSGCRTKRNSALNIVRSDNRKARQSLLCYDETQSIDVDELFDARQVSQVVDEPLVTIEVDEDEDWCRMQQQISTIKNIADLTDEHLSFLVLSQERYLRDIFQGKKSCKRHVLYRNGGKDRRCLSWMLPVGLFTYEQHELVLGVLMEIFCKKHQKYFDYLLRVLLPEILIKIVMDIYRLEHDAAENKMRERENRL